MAFFTPFVSQKFSVPVIIYPENGIESVFEDLHPEIENHLGELYATNSRHLEFGSYHIVIVWLNNNIVMTDVWIFSGLDNWSDNPTVDVKNFKNFDLDQSGGVTAGDGLILLGEEEKLRRKTPSLENYLANRPQLLAS